MGTSAKVINGTTSRVWRSPDSGLPAPSNGAFYSDLEFQDIWEDSRAQPGEAGILTNFLGGKAGLANENDALEIFRRALPRCRRRWLKTSTRRRSRPFSGPAIPSRSGATPVGHCGRSGPRRPGAIRGGTYEP